jgi:hypothetical protein
MNYFEVGGIIEIGIPKAKFDSYKRKINARKYITRCLWNFFDELEEIENAKIIYENNFNNYCINKELLRINDFNYGINNQCKENELMYVFRIFSYNFLIVPKNEKFNQGNLFGTYYYSYKDLKINLICSDIYKIPPRNNKGIKFYGKENL